MSHSLFRWGLTTVKNRINCNADGVMLDFWGDCCVKSAALQSQMHNMEVRDMCLCCAARLSESSKASSCILFSDGPVNLGISSEHVYQQLKSGRVMQREGGYKMWRPWKTAPGPAGLQTEHHDSTQQKDESDSKEWVKARVSQTRVSYCDCTSPLNSLRLEM